MLERNPQAAATRRRRFSSLLAKNLRCSFGPQKPTCKTFKKRTPKKGWAILRFIEKHNLQTGILNVCIGVLATFLFPITQSWQEASTQRQFNLLLKKEEMISKFCHTISFTLTLMDHLRNCHIIMQCDKKSPYQSSCDKIISDGTMALSTSQETYESVCELSSVYFSKNVGDKLDAISKKIDRLFSMNIPQCQDDDSRYNTLLAEIRDNDYPAVVGMMKKEVVLSRTHFN